MYSGDFSTDGGSLFGGGGFMPSQALPADSGFGASRKSGSQNNGWLFPVTIKQLSLAIQDSADDSLSVDGHDVSNVTLVGMISNKEERATDVSFMLDDGTGRVEVRRWVDAPDATESIELLQMPPGAYVRIHGHLRTFQGKRNIVAFAVRAITDFNEITMHFLECIFVHLYNIKSQGGGFKPQMTSGNGSLGNGSLGNGSISQIAPTNQMHVPAYNYNQYGGPPSAANGSADDCQKRVHAIFQDPAAQSIEQGLHIDEVARRMVGYNKKQVRDAVEFLVNEGYIYSTIDDDHFKSTS